VVNFRPETVVAIEAVEQALTQARAGTGGIHFKEGRDVVTDTDVAIEDAIRSSVEASLGYPVIGEERGGTAPTDSPYWLLDPICGTRNFASGIPLFAINLALVEDGEISIGVVGDGSIGDIHVAELGNGAWTLSEGARTRIKVSADSRIVDFEGWPSFGPERDRAAEVVATAIAADHWDIRFFSTTLALALVAQGGIAGCVLFAAPSLVHIAAGVLLASEANALVTTVDGEGWTLGSDSLLLCADEQLQRQLLDLVCR
jgi:myo-inositol-1(or 4)-monophosphatase